MTDTSTPRAFKQRKRRSSLSSNGTGRARCLDGEMVTITKFRLCDRIRAIERLAKLKGWDQPTKSQVSATTVAVAPDLSRLIDKELATVERLLEKVAG